MSVPNNWRRERIEELASHSLKMAFYDSTFDPDSASAYGVGGELEDDGYETGGYELTVASVTESGRNVLLDLEDSTITGMSATDWKYIVLYDEDDGNRIFGIMELNPVRNFSGKNVTVRWPPPNANQAILRFYG